MRNDKDWGITKIEFLEKVRDLFDYFAAPQPVDKILEMWWKRLEFAKDGMLRIGMELIPGFLPSELEKFSLSPLGILSVISKLFALNEWVMAREYADNRHSPNTKCPCSDKTKDIVKALGGWDAIRKDSPNLAANYWIFMDMWNYM